MARVRVEVTSTIDRTADVVFHALSDERDAHRWRSVSAADYDVGGPCVVGAKFWRATGGERRAFEVTGCHPYEVYSSASMDERERETLSCRSLDALTTRVERIIEREAPALLASVVRWRLRRRAASELASARRWLEEAAL